MSPLIAMLFNLRFRLLLLVLIGIAIVVAAQPVVNSWPSSVIAVSATDRGPIFGAVKRSDSNGLAIYRWSNDLSQRELLWRIPGHYIKGMRATDDASLLFIEGLHGVSAYDVATRRVIWSHATEEMSGARLFENDRVLLILTMGDFGYGAARITTLATSTGEILDTQVLNDASQARPSLGFQQVFFDPDLVTCKTIAGKTIVLTTRQGKIVSLDSSPLAEGFEGSQGHLLHHLVHMGMPARRIADVHRRDRISDTRMVEAFEATSNEPSFIRIVEGPTKKLVHRDPLGLKPTTKFFLSLLIVFLMVLFVTLLVRGAKGNENWQRAATGLLWLSLVTTLPFIGGLGDLVPDEIFHRHLAALAVPGGALAAVWFLWIMGTSNRLYVLTTLVFSSFVPILVPIVLAARAARRFGLRSPFPRSANQNELDQRISVRDPHNLRFNLGELLIAISLLAILFAQGPFTLWLFPIGVGLTVVIATAILASLNRSIALATVIAGTILVVVFAINGPRSWPSAGVVMLFATFSFLRLHGMRVERTKKTQPPPITAPAAAP